MGSFSKKSLEVLETCHPDLQRLAHQAIKLIDFAVVQGHRPVEEQQRLYASGRTAPGPILTKVDGVRVVGKHNHEPALAMDLCPWKPGVGLDWNDRESFSVMGGVFLALGAAMGIKLRWGGNWDNDEYFREKGDSWDLPHIELLTEG